MKRLINIFISFLRLRKVIPERTMASLSTFTNPYVDYGFFKILNLIRECEANIPEDGESKPIYRVTNTGALHVQSKEKVFMIPLGSFSRLSLKSSYEFHRENKHNFKLLGYNFNHSYLNGSIDCYLCDVLYPIERIINTGFHKKLIATGRIIQSNELSSFKSVSVRFVESVNDFKINRLLTDISEKLCSKQELMRFGFVHGDLTVENVMQDINSEIVFIDLDRSTVNGPVFLDEMHLYFSIASKKSSKSWLTHFLRELKKSRFKLEELVIYYMFRVSKEFSSHALPSFLYALKIINAGNEISLRLGNKVKCYDEGN